MNTSFNIVLNGEPRTVQDATLAELLRTIGLGTASVAVAINHQHIRRSAWDAQQVRDGDIIDILSPMAGG